MAKDSFQNLLTVSFPRSLTELPPFCNLIPSQKWNYKVDGKRTKRMFQSSSQKSDGENPLTEDAFTSTCSLFPQPNVLRWTPKHGLRPEQMLRCLQTPRASKAEGCWLLLGEEFRRAASFLLDLHMHAGWGEREEKKKQAQTKMPSESRVCVCHLLLHLRALSLLLDVKKGLLVPSAD